MAQEGGNVEDMPNLTVEGTIKAHGVICRPTLGAEDLVLIDKFSGNTNVDRFLDKFEAIGNHFKWEEKDKIFALKLKLEGEADICIKEHSWEENQTFQDLKNVLIERFQKPIDKVRALYQFWAYLQPQGMPVAQFISKATDLSFKAYRVGEIAPEIEECNRKAMLKNMLLTNLSPEIKKGIIVREPKSVEEIKKYAMLEEKAWQACSYKNPFANTIVDPPSNQPDVSVFTAVESQTKPEVAKEESNKEMLQLCEVLTKQVGVLSKRLEVVARESRDRTEANVKFGQSKREICHKCKRQGHFARDCRARSNCTGINPRDKRGRGLQQPIRRQDNQFRELDQRDNIEIGNQELKCDKKQLLARPDPVSETLNFTLEGNQKELPIVEINIGGKIVKALLDSGASINLINNSVLVKQVEQENCRINVKTLGGIIEVKTKTRVDFCIKDYKTSAKFYITNQPISNKFQVILGNEFLTENSCRLDFQTRLISNQHFVLEWGVEQGEEKQVYIAEVNINRQNFKTFGYVNKKTTIPPRCKIFVNVNIRGQIEGNLLLAENYKIAGEKGLWVARSVHNVNKSRSLPVLIMNTSESEIHLNKGTKLVNFEHVVSSEEILPQVNLLGVNEGEWENCGGADLEWKENFNLEHLKREDKSKIINLLNKNSDVFAKSVADLPGCSTFPHKINLTDNNPVRRRAYRVPLHLQKEMDSQINILLEAGILEPSTSAYSAPVLLVRKSTGDYRLVTDFRALNTKVVPDSYPLPNISETIDNLNNAHFFSTLDLTSGFFQQEIHPEDREKTAIITNRGLFQFTRTPFGLMTSAPAFQRLLDIILAGLREWEIFCYIDDVVVCSKTVDEHISKLQKVFDRFRQHKLKLKPSKCHFLKESITYLGFKVSKGKVEPDPKKIDSIQNIRSPKSKKEVRSFLGCVNYYRRFISDYSKRSVALTNLLKKALNFKWSEEAEAEFLDLKTCLTKSPCLILPDLSKEFIIYTDASNYAVGGVLCQLDDNGFPRPVAFGSRKLMEREARYSTTEREMLAIIFAVHHFKHYLLGKKFTIFSDHASLSHIFKSRDPTGRLARWSMALAQFQFEIKYIQGKCNKVADFLSRDLSLELTSEQPQTAFGECHAVTEISIQNSLGDNIKELQQTDRKCKNLMQAIESNKPIKPEKLKFYVRDGMLVCHDKKDLGRKERIVVPESLIKEIFNLHHDSPTACHPGVGKTLSRIRQQYYWPGMYAHTVNWVKSCLGCLGRKAHKPSKPAPMQRMPIPEGPFDRVAFDICGPYPVTNSGNRYLFTFSDYFTRWAEAYPTHSVTSEEIAKVMLKFISRFGCPQHLVTDRGANIISQGMTKLYQELGIQKHTTTAFRPQSNGVVERWHASLTSALAHLVNENHNNWDEKLDLALLAYRTAIHDTTKETPSFLVYGRELKLPYHFLAQPLERTYAESGTWATELLNRFKEVYSQVRKNLIEAAEKQEKVREKCSVDKNLKVGDLVVLFYPQLKPGLSRKFSKPNRGVFRILRKVSPVNYEIGEINQPTKTQIVHVDRINKIEKRIDFPDHIRMSEEINKHQEPIVDSNPREEQEVSEQQIGRRQTRIFRIENSGDKILTGSNRIPLSNRDSRQVPSTSGDYSSSKPDSFNVGQDNKGDKSQDLTSRPVNKTQGGITKGNKRVENGRAQTSTQNYSLRPRVNGFVVKV